MATPFATLRHASLLLFICILASEYQDAKACHPSFFYLHDRLLLDSQAYAVSHYVKTHSLSGKGFKTRLAEAKPVVDFVLHKRGSMPKANEIVDAVGTYSHLLVANLKNKWHASGERPSVFDSWFIVNLWDPRLLEQAIGKIEREWSGDLAGASVHLYRRMKEELVRTKSIHRDLTEILRTLESLTAFADKKVYWHSKYRPRLDEVVRRIDNTVVHIYFHEIGPDSVNVFFSRSIRYAGIKHAVIELATNGKRIKFHGNKWRTKDVLEDYSLGIPNLDRRYEAPIYSQGRQKSPLLELLGSLEI